MSPELREAYQLLSIKPSASDEDISKAFKKLALKYHPDRNPGKTEWANSVMSKLNSAYSLIISERFSTAGSDESSFKAQQQAYAQKARQAKAQESYQQERKKSDYFAQQVIRDQIIKSFVKSRENVKDYLYRYFQFKLYNLARRDDLHNRSAFKDVVNNIKAAYHQIGNLEKSTRDEELIQHFKIFMKMILGFYKSSECLNFLDSYNNKKDVEAYRLFHQGDQYLLEAEKEVFYERHNRGSFFQAQTLENAMNAKLFFMQTLRQFPESTWSVETKIKLDYTEALINYIDLFFNE